MNNELHQQFVRDMLTESFEGLDRFDQDILQLEKGGVPDETLHTIFRVVHTLKGTAGCLGFTRIQRLAHAGENVLDRLREHQLAPSTALAGVLLRLSDGLRAHLTSIDATGREADADHGALIAELDRIHQPSTSVPEPAAAPRPAIFPEASVPAEIPVATAEPAGWGLFDPLPEASFPAPSNATAASESSETPPAFASTATTATAAPASSSSVRVDTGHLDRLMNLVGELVLARNQLMQVAQSRTARPETVAEVSQRLNRITTELQEGVMKTRMQPIGNVWSKLPRIVRDIAVGLGKQVRLETIGSETELDRTIVEAIRDPLTHIIRNSIDHGIESPEVRVQAGKPAEGTLLMRAFHEGGRVNIEIVDDGAGINLHKVRQRALERALLSADDAARLSERELIALIFAPGFSTAEKVSDVSGRGVGMDVVRTNIEKIGGSVDVQTTAGEGTTLRIKIPLTLAIVPALIVRSGAERFAIPQVSLVELVRLEGEAATRAIEQVYGAPVFRLRGQLLPLVFLHAELKLVSKPALADVVHIVVLQSDSRQFGLVVDAICDTEEIVVKPLGKHLMGLPMFAGATIMGDGRVALILDVPGLAQHARLLGENRERAASRQAAGADDASERSQLLLFSLGGRERLAMDLDQAARLEEFSRDRIEFTAGREAVQYRGRILPLVRVGRHLPGAHASAATGDEKIQVIVYEKGGHAVGLVVDRICDIIEEVVDLQPGSATPGIAGSAIVQGRITDLVDVAYLLNAAGVSTTRAA